MGKNQVRKRGVKWSSKEQQRLKRQLKVSKPQDGAPSDPKKDSANSLVSNHVHIDRVGSAHSMSQQPRETMSERNDNLFQSIWGRDIQIKSLVKPSAEDDLEFLIIEDNFTFPPDCGLLDGGDNGIGLDSIHKYLSDLKAPSKIDIQVLQALARSYNKLNAETALERGEYFQSIIETIVHNKDLSKTAQRKLLSSFVCESFRHPFVASDNEIKLTSYLGGLSLLFHTNQWRNELEGWAQYSFKMMTVALTRGLENEDSFRSGVMLSFLALWVNFHEVTRLQPIENPLIALLLTYTKFVADKKSESVIEASFLPCLNLCLSMMATSRKHLPIGFLIIKKLYSGLAGSQASCFEKLLLNLTVYIKMLSNHPAFPELGAVLDHHLKKLSKMCRNSHHANALKSASSEVNKSIALMSGLRLDENCEHKGGLLCG